MNGDVLDLFSGGHKNEMEAVHPETGLTVKIKAIRYNTEGCDRGFIFDEPTRWPCHDGAIGRLFCGNCKYVTYYSQISVDRGEEHLPPGITFDELDYDSWYWDENKEKRTTKLMTYCEKGNIKLSNNNSACELHSKFEEPDPQDEMYEIDRVRSNLTDIGNGQRLAYRHGKDLKYCHVWGKWLVWDGKRWETDATAEIDRRAKETVFSIYTEASSEQIKKADRQKIIEHAQRSESNRALKAMLEMASSENGIVVRQESLDVEKYKINLRNFTLDLKDLKHYEHRRDDLITKIANVEYRLDAQCPKWIDFLNLIFDDDQDTIKYIQKLCGYCLSGDIGEQKVFFLWGAGENGKSTFLDVIMAILGDYAMSCPAETFMVKDFSGNGPNNDLARLKGARCVTAAEIEAGKKLAESLVKQLTGGDKMSARFLRQEYFEFTPEFKLLFCTNHKPDISGTDHGIWRRVKLIPFNVIVPKKLAELNRESVKNYHEVLIKEESSGILNWMLQGWILWMREGLKDSESVKDATNEYRAEMDVLGRFIDECCIVEPTAKVLLKELYARYIVWYNENNGNSKYAMGDRRFNTIMREKGFSSKASTGNQKYWFGITINYEVTKLPLSTKIPGLTNTYEGTAVYPGGEVTKSNLVTINESPIILSLAQNIKEQVKLMSDKLYDYKGTPQSALVTVLTNSNIYSNYTENNVLLEIKKLLEIGELQYVDFDKKILDVT